MRSSLLLLLLALSCPSLARSPLVGDLRFPDRSGGLRDAGALRGRIAVAVLILESTGPASRFDWDAWRVQKVMDEMDEMLAWWNQLGAGQGLELVPAPDHYGRLVEIDLEPLDGQHTSMHECRWDSAAMAALGFGEACLTSVGAFNEAVRAAADADQAATIFVIDDGDTQATFPGGGSAWAWWGGPSCQVTYSNGGWGVDTLAMVAGHELAHVFHAFDEYSQPGHSVCSCDDSWNGCANGNCLQASGQPCGGWHDVCIMAPEQEEAWAEHHVCAYTACHLGWVCVDEACNGVDDDCDGLVDEGLGSESCGLGACAHEAALCQAGALVACDPYEGATPEVCNGLDDDCDGTTDVLAVPQGGAPVACDADGDGSCSTLAPCDGPSPGCPDGCGDCDDGDPAVHPLRLERCGGIDPATGLGVDDDCDGLTDEPDALGCALHYADADGDGAGASGSGLCLCAPDAGHPATTGGDCDDDDPTAAPGLPGTCSDCDGRIAPGCPPPSLPDADAEDEALPPGPEATAGTAHPGEGAGCAIGGQPTSARNPGRNAWILLLLVGVLLDAARSRRYP